MILIFYISGWIGLFAFGVAPISAYMSCKKQFSLTNSCRNILFIVCVASSILLSIVAANTSLKIFLCLTTDYCGPSTGSGWQYLSIFGIAFLGYEVLTLFLNYLGQKYYSS